MRALLSLLLALAVVAAAGCSSCVDQPAQPVTLQLKNQLAWPIFVHDEDDQLGLTVQESIVDTWVDMKELSHCASEDCATVCDPVDCPVVVAWAQRVEPGATLSRVWSGEYRANEEVQCPGDGEQACLGDRKAAQPGTYRLKLCYASSLPNVPSGEDRFIASFPDDSKLSCALPVDFKLPASGPVTVETSPAPGCRTAADCPSGQMCLSGGCSSTCVPNEVTPLGTDWSLEVGSPDDLGFFTTSTNPDGSLLYTGTGTVASRRYSSGTTNLTLTRTDSGLNYTASLYYTLPGTMALALNVGDELEVAVVDYSQASSATSDRQQARAIVLRQAGKLLLAADNGAQGQVLDAAQLAPFSVDPGGDIAACDVGDCGKRMYHLMHFALAGSDPDAGAPAGDGGSAATSLDLLPGKTGTLEVGADTYEVVPVADYDDEVSGCGPSPMTPYLILIQRPSP